MKKINNYIVEKLRISKNEEIYIDFTQEIIEAIMPDPNECESKLRNQIDKWVNDSNVKKLTFISTKQVLLDLNMEEYEIDELLNYYNDQDRLKFILDEDMYDKESVNIKISNKVWEDDYGYNSLYKYNDKSVNKLAYFSRTSGYIYIIANKEY